MKNVVQILVLSLVAVFGFVWVTNAAYTLTGDELKQVNSQKAVISEATDYGLRNYYSQLYRWHNILEKNDRLGKISGELRDYALSVFDSRKKVSKQQSVLSKSEFVDKYKDNIMMEDEFPLEKCTWRYNTIDNISFANNFPTALTLAVWYRESSCGYYLPANGDGPFQIVSKDYGTWEITEEIFKQSVQDFIDFAKNKINNYNNKADEEFPEIILTYTWFNMTGIVSFAAMYNGWTREDGMVKPNSPKYVYDGYGEEYANAKKYGVLPAFLELLEWEIGNM